MPTTQQKHLQRIPQVFSKVLELPLRSKSDVSVEDRSDCFRFIATIEDNAFVGQVIKAHAVKIHPEVTKVVVRGVTGRRECEFLDKLEVDEWRYRLPETTRPELATAFIVGKELTVTVPKGGPRRG